MWWEKCFFLYFFYDGQSDYTILKNTVLSAGLAITITHPSALNHLPQRNLPSKVASVQIPSPKPAICNVMRCLAGLIRPLALCLLIPPSQWQRSDVTGGGRVIKDGLVKFLELELFCALIRELQESRHHNVDLP